jgi:MerR family mercuric resistance operon transcriptional regulator
LRISDLARAGEVGVETVRFYQRRGLLARPDGSAAGARHYGAEDVRRLRFIRKAQSAGFTLSQILELLELDRSDDRARIRRLAAERISELDERIAELQSARTSLSRLERECASGGGGPCPIIEAFES